jgi:hypothetical protein
MVIARPKFQHFPTGLINGERPRRVFAIGRNYRPHDVIVVRDQTADIRPQLDEMRNHHDPITHIRALKY